MLVSGSTVAQLDLLRAFLDCSGDPYSTATIMASSRTFYDVLRVGPHAQKGEIKENYRKLALRHHPDKDLGNPHATAEFQEVSFTIR